MVVHGHILEFTTEPMRSLQDRCCNCQLPNFLGHSRSELPALCLVAAHIKTDGLYFFAQIARFSQAALGQPSPKLGLQFRDQSVLQAE